MVTWWSWGRRGGGGGGGRGGGGGGGGPPPGGGGGGVEHLPLADHYHRHHLPVWFSTMRVRNRAYNVREKRAKEEEERKK